MNDYDHTINKKQRQITLIKKHVRQKLKKLKSKCLTEMKNTTSINKRKQIYRYYLNQKYKINRDPKLKHAIKKLKYDIKKLIHKNKIQNKIDKVDQELSTELSMLDERSNILTETSFGYNNKNKKIETDRKDKDNFNNSLESFLSFGSDKHNILNKMFTRLIHVCFN
jgi:hypothetical protein